jgi:hypothetical protein
MGFARALRRPLFVALLVGCCVAMLGTRHVTPALVVSTTVCWSVLVAMQVLIALVVIAGPARRGVGVGRALDLFFAAHAPWSLWMLALVAWHPTSVEKTLTPILAAAIVPLVLTIRSVHAFFREVLGLSLRAATARTAAHQALTWSLLLTAYGAAIAAIPRILQWVR